MTGTHKQYMCIMTNVQAMATFYFGGQTRYRKTKHTTVIGVQNIVTCKHANLLAFPRRDSNPDSALGFYRRTNAVEKLVPREKCR